MAFCAVRAHKLCSLPRLAYHANHAAPHVKEPVHGGVFDETAGFSMRHTTQHYLRQSAKIRCHSSPAHEAARVLLTVKALSACTVGASQCCLAARPRRLRTSTQQCHCLAGQSFAIDDSAGQFPVKATDVGGLRNDPEKLTSWLEQVPLDESDQGYQFWERQAHALFVLLASKGHLNVDELRTTVAGLDLDRFATWGYYDKWAAAMATALLDSGILLPNEFDAALGWDSYDAAQMSGDAPYSKGTLVRVRGPLLVSRWRRPHPPARGRFSGTVGVVEGNLGAFADAEFHGFRGDSSPQRLYRVRFQTSQVCPNCTGLDDTINVDIYESWLEPVPKNEDLIASLRPQSSQRPTKAASKGAASKMPKRRQLRLLAQTVAQELHDSGMQQQHQQPTWHQGHQHLTRDEIEQEAADKEVPETPGSRIVEALVAVLSAAGVVTQEGLRRAIETIDSVGINASGPTLVARAWIDGEFRRRLLSDASTAAMELGIAATSSTSDTVLTVVESTKDVHNLVVCTLCSCYPVSLLGLPPPWYKSTEYRSCAIANPRQLLEESFGVLLPEAVHIRVHDSTAHQRYLVLPVRRERGL